MLEVLGVGAYFPSGSLSLEFIAELGGGKSGIPSTLLPTDRRSIVLSADYLKATKEFAPGKLWQSEFRPLETPTTLGAEAARRALESATVLPEQVGLVIAETCTPLETTPGESQRVAGMLGVRCTAFDIGSGGLGFSQILKAIAAWKPQATPEYVLCVSTHTPSWYTDYRQGDARWVVGDGAAAVLLSRKHRGRWAVVETRVERQPVPSKIRSILPRPLVLPFPWFRGTGALEEFVAAHSSEYQVFPHLDERVTQEHKKRFSLFSAHGYCFGASSFAAFAENEAKISGGRVSIFETDLDRTFGEVTLERR